MSKNRLLFQYRWNPGYQGQSAEKFDLFYATMKTAMFPTNPPAIQPICANLKNSLPSLAGGNVFGTFSE